MLAQPPHLSPPSPAFQQSIERAYPKGFPLRIGPYSQPGSPLEPVIAHAVEVMDLLDGGRGAAIRVGFTKQPALATAQGTVAALDPAARAFVQDWLDRQGGALPAACHRSFTLDALVGYSLTLMPFSTGSLQLTFHRDGERFYIRTFGGCMAPRADWYGPFVRHGDHYGLETAATS